MWYEAQDNTTLYRPRAYRGNALDCCFFVELRAPGSDAVMGAGPATGIHRRNQGRSLPVWSRVDIAQKVPLHFDCSDYRALADRTHAKLVASFGSPVPR